MKQYEITVGEFIDSHTTGRVSRVVVSASNMSEAIKSALAQSPFKGEAVRVNRIK